MRTTDSVCASFRAVLAVVLAVLTAGTHAHGQAPNVSQDCNLDQIEEVMRAYQARYAAASALLSPDNRPKHVEWPGCCDSGNAPSYPPDNYYDDALASNPALGPVLVRSLRRALLDESSLETHRLYLSAPASRPLSEGGLNPESLPIDAELPRFNPHYPGDTDLITRQNACVQLALIRQKVEKMRKLVIPPGEIWVGTNEGLTAYSSGTCVGSTGNNPATAFSSAIAAATNCLVDNQVGGAIGLIVSGSAGCPGCSSDVQFPGSSPRYLRPNPLVDPPPSPATASQLTGRQIEIAPPPMHSACEKGICMPVTQIATCSPADCASSQSPGGGGTAATPHQTHPRWLRAVVKDGAARSPSIPAQLTQAGARCSRATGHANH